MKIPKSKHILSFLATLLLITIFLGCNKKKEVNKRYKIGFAQAQGGDNWRESMLKEMQREVSFYNEIDFYYKDAQANSKIQKDQIQELIDLKVDLLIVSPHEIQPLNAILEKAFDSKIPIVLIDRRITSDKYTAFIGASNYEVGQNAGKYAVALLKGKGKVLEITGLNTASPFIDRDKGFIDIISKSKGIELIAKINDHEANFEKKLDSFIKNNKDLDVIFAQSDYLAKNVYQICKNNQVERKIKIIGVDGLSIEGMGMDMVASNQFKATVLYPTGGQEAIRTAIKILEKKPFKKENTLETTIIDSTNVKILQQQSKKVIEQQNEIDNRQLKINQQILISKNQTNIILAISITLAIALILSSVFYYLFKENKKISKKLMVQKDEISSQKNELEKLVKQVKEATDAKFDFFTNISHELRTPLTLIIGPLEDTLTSSRLHFSLKNNLELVQRNSFRLLKLINQLMDFRKIEEGKMEINASTQVLGDFVFEISNEFKDLARKKHISLNINDKTTGLIIDFDQSMIDKVLFNLLSNAFKFTEENGTINITIDQDKEQENAIIKIEDNGIGMSAEDVEHAFDVFYQGHSSTFKGTGLGLALSKELIIAHNGNIIINSKKGNGTCFTIILPFKQNNKNKELRESEYNDGKNLKEKHIYTTDVLPHNYEKVTTNISEKSASILIIEDNDDLNSFLRNRLEGTYEVLTAKDGNEGVNKAFDVIPDLIISDIIMPGMSGLKLAEILKNDLRTSHIPIILLTAKTSIEDQIEGMKSHADMFIIKPFNLNYLEESIASILKNRIILREHFVNELPSESRSNASNKLDRKFISEFTSIIESNLSNEDLSVDDIYKGLGISKIQLYRKTKALLGFNVNDYILSVRLQKAKYLLMNEDLTISEVAYKVGFSSQAYFSTVFKSKFSVTPSEFKESSKK
ncbi:MAG: substrate-binding domain-containing protein [Chitinophagaceae bacterium]|jgi:signal transduction histidine kinase/AraC-like DNA-binding protein|nr:substrate-binding domain-containing protein [Chitinophagaceae bacterium]